jgi:OB-fold nucleic acid binding protein
MSDIQSPTVTPGVRRTWVAELPGSLGSIVRVSGFLETIRDQKRMQFLVLRDRTGAVQLTHDKASNGEIAERIAALTPGSANGASVALHKPYRFGSVYCVIVCRRRGAASRSSCTRPPP